MFFLSRLVISAPSRVGVYPFQFTCIGKSVWFFLTEHHLDEFLNEQVQYLLLLQVALFISVFLFLDLTIYNFGGFFDRCIRNKLRWVRHTKNTPPWQERLTYLSWCLYCITISCGTVPLGRKENAGKCEWAINATQFVVTNNKAITQYLYISKVSEV
jgi:hypothetical protein